MVMMVVVMMMMVMTVMGMRLAGIVRESRRGSEGDRGRQYERHESFLHHSNVLRDKCAHNWALAGK
jgi:hypothetical protein